MPHPHMFRHGGGPSQSAEPSGPPMPEKSSTEFILVDPARVRFVRDGAKVLLRQEGQAPVRVALYRLFPLSEPEAWLSVLDEKGVEIGIIRYLCELDKESQSCLRVELRRRYHVARICRILACRERYDVVEWEVETDRGTKTILLRDVRNNIQQRGPNRFVVTDVDGNRYDIPDVSALDVRSRLILERYS